MIDSESRSRDRHAGSLPEGDLGAVLRRARERRDLDLEELARRLRLEPRVLRMLENNLFEELPAWLAEHPKLDLEAPIDLAGHEVVSVPVRAGDLVIWDSRLPHHGGPNRGLAPRLSVPISMWPEGGEQERSERVACWEQKRAPACWRGWMPWLGWGR